MASDDMIRCFLSQSAKKTKGRALPVLFKKSYALSSASSSQPSLTISSAEPALKLELLAS